MKTFITFLAISLFSTGLFAQKFIQEWYIQLPGLASAEATAIMTTSDNQLLIAGYSNTSSSNGSMFFIKTDTAGNVVHTTFSDEQFVYTYQMANRLMKDIDNNYVMIGYYSAYQKTYFTKLSPDGTILSTHINGGQYDYKGGHDIVQTPDSGYLVSAQKENYGIGMCLAVRKLDLDGSFLWDTTFVHPEDSTAIMGNFGRMAKINDTTFVLTGDYAPGSAGDLDILQAKIRVYNDSVKLLRLTIYELDGTDEKGYDILTLPNDEGYIMCGVGVNENNPGAKVGVIMRTDTAGNLIWKEIYSNNINSNTGFLKIHLNEDNDILVLAQTGGGSSNASLLKYSLDGELLQKEHFDYGVNETAYDFTIDQDGKIYVAAGTWSLSHRDALLLKVKDICPVSAPEATLNDTILQPGGDVITHVQNTNEAWSYSLIQINGEVTLGTYMGNGNTLDFTTSNLTNEDVSEGLVVSVIEPGVDCIRYSDTLHMVFYDGIEDRYQNDLVIAPNPFRNYITISTNDINNLPVSLSVYNLSGKLLLEETNISNNQKIILANLSKGIYFVALKNKKGKTSYRKVIKF